MPALNITTNNNETVSKGATAVHDPYAEGLSSLDNYISAQSNMHSAVAADTSSKYDTANLIDFENSSPIEQIK